MVQVSVRYRLINLWGGRGLPSSCPGMVGRDTFNSTFADTPGPAPCIQDVLRDQASEQRIGEWGRRKTQAFNGYADQVAHMYDGMDLSYYH